MIKQYVLSEDEYNELTHKKDEPTIKFEVYDLTNCQTIAFTDTVGKAGAIIQGLGKVETVSYNEYLIKEI